MSFWEMLALVSAMATIMGVFLTIYAMLNNRLLKEESAHTREILARMEHGQQRLEEGQQRMEQGQQNIQKEMAESRREMAEAIKYVADLVRGEGERTRQALRASSS